MTNGKKVDYSDLFRLSDPLATKPYRLSPIGEDWIHKLDEGGLFAGILQPSEPVLLKATRGGTATHFLWSGLTSLICISQRIVNLFTNNNITGWSTYPVTVYDRQNNLLPGYYGFAVKSLVGKNINDIDYSRSQLITKPPIVPGGSPKDVYKGLYFDESKWDGSDIFRLIGTIIVTSKVRKILKKEKITNIMFTPLLEYEEDVSTVSIIKKSLESPPTTFEERRAMVEKFMSKY